MSKKFHEFDANDEVAEAADLTDLKANSVDVTSWEDYTVNDGVENLPSMLAGAVRYAVNTAGTILDRRVNVVTSGTFTIPANFTDLVIRFTGTPVSLTFADSGITDYGDDLPTTSADWLVTVSRIGTAEAYVRFIELKERS